MVEDYPELTNQQTSLIRKPSLKIILGKALFPGGTMFKGTSLGVEINERRIAGIWKNHRGSKADTCFIRLLLQAVF